MVAPPTSPKHPQSPQEEFANALSHGAGLLATLVGWPILVVAAVHHGGAAGIVGASVFGATMVLLYFTSTCYHALPPGKTKQTFRVLDHAAIFLLIAGTYTPFTLGVLHGAWGWTLFGIVWGLAVTGVALKAVFGMRLLSTGIYIAMGWLIVIAVKPLWLGMSPAGFLWLLAGGMAYTSGVAFYAAKRLRFSHFIWHLFVITGTMCHFVAVLRYAI